MSTLSWAEEEIDVSVNLKYYNRNPGFLIREKPSIVYLFTWFVLYSCFLKSMTITTLDLLSSPGKTKYIVRILSFYKRVVVDTCS